MTLEAPSVRLLFVCARNRLRSPTAEHVFSAVPGFETDSAGIAPDAENPVTPDLIAWADLILVMEATHRAKLTKSFSKALRGKRLVCLDIPDNYAFMDPELIQLLWACVTGAENACAVGLRTVRPGSGHHPGTKLVAGSHSRW